MEETSFLMQALSECLLNLKRDFMLHESIANKDADYFAGIPELEQAGTKEDPLPHAALADYFLKRVFSGEEGQKKINIFKEIVLRMKEALDEIEKGIEALQIQGPETGVHEQKGETLSIYEKMIRLWNNVLSPNELYSIGLHLVKLSQALDNRLKSFELSAKMGKKHLILFADDILKSAVIFDLEETLKMLAESSNLLKGGTIVLYTKDESLHNKVTALERLIEKVLPDATVIVRTPQDIYGSASLPAYVKPVNELDGLLRDLTREDNDRDGRRDIEERDIFAIIRGNGVDMPSLYGAYSHKIPLIIINNNNTGAKGIFSFAEALQKAQKTYRENPPNPSGWIRILERIEGTEELYSKYLLYRESILTQL